MQADFRFKVTAEHIAGARPGDMNRCAVADALTDRGYTKVSVAQGSLSFEREGERWYCIELPLEIKTFIALADRHLLVEPCSFTFTAKNGEE